MTAPIYSHDANGGFLAIRDDNGGVILAASLDATGTPTASAAGFSKGCIWSDRINGLLYINEGTNASATWSVFTTASEGAAVSDPAALTSATLTDNSAGTANTTVEALSDGTTYANDVASIRNNFADLAASNNAIIADITAIRTQLIALITSLENANIIAT